MQRTSRIRQAEPKAGWRRRCGLRVGLAALAAAASAPGSAWAQLPQTRLLSLFPAGAQRGVPTEVVLANGTDLEGITSLQFSHPGIRAEPKVTMADGKAVPVANTFVVTAADDVAPGVYDAYCVGKFGISNPRSFVIGLRPEAAETEPNNAAAQAMALPLNTVINGRSNGGTDVDWYKFTAKAGERLTIECTASRIDSRMEPMVSIHNASGRLLRMTTQSERKRGDPLLEFSAPADGEYLLKVHDFVYQGSNDHFYRLCVHNGPTVLFVMPPCGVPGTTAEFTLFGWNLPGSTAVEGTRLEQLKTAITIPPDGSRLDPPDLVTSFESAADGFAYSFAGSNGTAAPVLISYARAPVVIEQEPNDLPEAAQKIAVPVEVAAQFATRGDVDAFVFEAKKGDVYWIDVLGQLTGSVVDPYVVVEQLNVDAQGKVTASRLTALDETPVILHPTAPQAFDSRSDDVRYRFAAPADAQYRVTVRDRFSESRGSPEYVYRLSIHPEQPDFRLITVPTSTSPVNNNGSPWAVTLRRGDATSVDVLLWRIDGFNESVVVTVEGLPPGVSCTGAAIGPGQTVAQLVFTSTEEAAPWAGSIRVVGRAKVPAGEIVRESRYGTVVWAGENGGPAMARIARTLGLAVNEETAAAQLAIEMGTIEVSQGSQILVPVKLLKRNGFDDNVQLQILGQPGNVQVENKPINKGTDSQVLRIFVQNNAPPGTYTLVVRGQGAFPYRRNAAEADAAQKEKEAADKLLEEKSSVVRNLVKTKVGADRAVKETGEAAAKAKTAAEGAAKAATETAQAQTKADEAAKAAAKALTDAEAAAKDAEAKAAAAKEASDKDPNNADLKKAAEDAAAAAVTAAENAKKAATAKAEADKQLTDAAAAATKAAEEKTNADKALADAEAAAKTAADEQKKVDEMLAAAKAEQEAAMKVQAEIAKKAMDLANVSKPQNVQLSLPGAPLLVTVKAAPANLAVNVPNNGALKKGEKLEVKVTVNRINGFAGPVELSLPLPPGVAGLSADPVTVPADQKEAVLSITATADAPDGQVNYMVVRGTAEFNGKTTFDIPLPLNISK